MIAGGELAMRIMKKMPDSVVSFYMNLTLAITMLIAIKLNDGNFGTFLQFGYLDWFLMLTLSITTIAS